MNEYKALTLVLHKFYNALILAASVFRNLKEVFPAEEEVVADYLETRLFRRTKIPQKSWYFSGNKS